ncbi:MAG TPA: type I 3-dehydroquinate dehydratase [Lachnospiraceae bacterium]|nr:type I 3-dehydroquinate dehydratase [Lachnospiraceae bacterium]
MTKAIIVKGCVIGEGMPKICVPVMGSTEDEIILQAGEAAAKGPDLVEWRADFFAGVKDRDSVHSVLDNVRNCLGDIPLLFTVRTRKEGGALAVPEDVYDEILTEAAGYGRVDMVDVEVMHDINHAARLIETLHKSGATVIGSNHHFHETPDTTEMRKILSDIEQAGADILKLAVMPDTAEDVLRLLMVTEEYRRQTERPLITMSMGRLGAISRLTGELVGSAVTFGSVAEASAPGQIDMSEMRKILTVLHA